MGMSKFRFFASSHTLIILYFFTFTREAQIVFKARKNHNGFFNANDLLRQVDRAIDIFKGLTNGWAQGLFLFDNMPSHQKHAPDAISAQNMVKGVQPFLFPPTTATTACPVEQWGLFVLVGCQSQ